MALTISEPRRRVRDMDLAMGLGGTLVGTFISTVEDADERFPPVATAFEQAGARVARHPSLGAAIEGIEHGLTHGRPFDLLFFDRSAARRDMHKHWQSLPLPCRAIGVCTNGTELDASLARAGIAMLSGAVPASFVLSLAETLLSDPVTTYARAQSLSAREEAVLRGAALGLDFTETARNLSCSAETVRTYWKRIFQKTGQRTQRDVLAHLLRQHARIDPGPFSDMTRCVHEAHRSDTAA